MRFLENSSKNAPPSMKCKYDIHVCSQSVLVVPKLTICISSPFPLYIIGVCIFILMICMGYMYIDIRMDPDAQSNDSDNAAISENDNTVLPVSDQASAAVPKDSIGHEVHTDSKEQKPSRNVRACRT